MQAIENLVKLNLEFEIKEKSGPFDANASIHDIYWRAKIII